MDEFIIFVWVSYCAFSSHWCFPNSMFRCLVLRCLPHSLRVSNLSRARELAYSTGKRIQASLLLVSDNWPVHRHAPQIGYALFQFYFMLPSSIKRWPFLCHKGFRRSAMFTRCAKAGAVHCTLRVPMFCVRRCISGLLYYSLLYFSVSPMFAANTARIVQHHTPCCGST